MVAGWSFLKQTTLNVDLDLTFGEDAEHPRHISQKSDFHFSKNLKRNKLMN